MPSPRQQAKEFNRTVRARLAGTEPVRMCAHPTNLRFISRYSPDIAQCGGCWEEFVLEVHQIRPCDWCGGKLLVTFQGYREVLTVDRPLPALPGFRGQVVLDVIWLCGDCKANRSLLTQAWWMFRQDEILRHLRAKVLQLTAVLQGQPLAVCGIHLDAGLFPLSFGPCQADHLSIVNCSVCDAVDDLRPRDVCLVVPKDEPLRVIDGAGQCFEVSDLLWVAPVAYVCKPCGDVWEHGRLPGGGIAPDAA